MSPILFPYVGPPQLLHGANTPRPRATIRSPQDVLAWIHSTQQQRDRQGLYLATYVVTTEGELRVADRRSEHVRLAEGQPVQAAGEIGFELTGADMRVAYLSNLSTGYCPAATAWPQVVAALGHAGIPAPAQWTDEFVFGRCRECNGLAVVKHDDWTCLVCGGELGEVHPGRP